jgi:hypothetical protein
VLRTILRAWLPALTLCLLAGSAAATSTARADTQLNNITTQVTDLQRHIDQALAGGATAQPGALTAAAVCGYAPSAQVFLPWADAASYSLAPQGDLVNVDGWKLDKTSLSTDASPWSAGHVSLRIPGNGQATTPPMCVNLSHPTIRLFIKNGAKLNTDLKVDVLYENLQGNVTTLNLAKLRTTNNVWQPSISIPIGVNIASAGTTSGYAAVAFVFKPEGLAAGQYWAIDSLYVDPLMHR